MKNGPKKQQGAIGRAYERFLALPVPVVLAVMWLGGVALIGLALVILYLYWAALWAMA